MTGNGETTFWTNWADNRKGEWKGKQEKEKKSLILQEQEQPCHSHWGSGKKTNCDIFNQFNPNALTQT